MIRVWNWWIGLALALTMLTSRVNAQVDQLLPEIDLSYKLTSELRASFQAKATHEGGETTSAEIGPSIKPLLKLKNVTRFDLDDSKSRPIVFSIDNNDQRRIAFPIDRNFCGRQSRLPQPCYSR